MSNTVIERGACVVKRVKTRLRNHLKNDMLSICLPVSINGLEPKSEECQVVMAEAAHNPHPCTRGAWKALAHLYKFLCWLLHFLLLQLQNLMVHMRRRNLNAYEVDGHATVMRHGKQTCVSTQGNPEIWGKTTITTKKRKNKWCPVPRCTTIRARLDKHLTRAHKIKFGSVP